MKQSDPVIVEGREEQRLRPSLVNALVRKTTDAPEAREKATDRGAIAVGLLRLGLGVGAVLTGSPWALPLLAWILLAHLFVDEK